MKQLSFVCLMFVLCGCVKLQLLPYMDQALTLQDLGQEKDRQDKLIKTTDAQFEHLQAAIASGEIKNYKTKKDIGDQFGPPVCIFHQGEGVEEALYRYAIQSKGPHKVYLYYDQSGQLTRWKSL
jgi:hypothetical protein